MSAKQRFLNVSIQRMGYASCNDANAIEYILAEEPNASPKILFSAARSNCSIVPD